MTRRLPSAPGRRRPDVPWLRPLMFVPLVLLATVMAACGQATVTEQPSSAAGSPSIEAGATAQPASGPGESSAGEPSESAAPSSATPAEPSTGGSTGSGSAAACSGSDENRDFYASMAAAVDWTVYCPVLPDGWFVGDGHYRLAGGGWMEITYDGPGDASIILRQGAFCTSGDSCVPGGRSIGDVPFGDRTGTLSATDNGGWAIVAERGATNSWLLILHGVDEAAARAIAVDLRVVG